jgi:hypothetical protein
MAFVQTLTTQLRLSVCISGTQWPFVSQELKSKKKETENY